MGGIARLRLAGADGDTDVEALCGCLPEAQLPGAWRILLLSTAHFGAVVRTQPSEPAAFIRSEP